MKKLLIVIVLFLSINKAFAQNTRVLDSLKTVLQNTTNDTLKADIYKQIATGYLQYDTIKSEGIKHFYQDEALNYTMLALHNFSYYGDILGVRTCFEYLSKVYLSQNKYSQAKWFMLQATKISRDRNDFPAVVSSLIKLATIKMSNEEYDLAMQDLDEAFMVSNTNKLYQFQGTLYKTYGYLFNRMGEEDKDDQALLRIQKLTAQFKKDQAAQALAARRGLKTKKPKPAPVQKERPKPIDIQSLMAERP